MGSHSPQLLRRQEVTRTIYLSSPDPDKPGPILGPHQMQTVLWDGPVEALLGYSLDEIRGTEAWWLDRIHPEDRAGVLEGITNHLQPAPNNPFAAESRIWAADYRFRHVNGSYVLLSDRSTSVRDESGRVVRHESVLFDRDARRDERARHARHLESQNSLALIANNTPSGIFMMDPQGYCIFMNSAAEQITGFTFQEIYDYTFHASVHSCRPSGEPYPLLECPVFDHQREGTAAKNEPEVFVHKDGHHYDIEYSVSPIGNYSSGGAVIEFRDVTDQKRIERERLNAILMNEQQSIRIKADDVHKVNMTSFVSFVCHELRNPLQGVSSSAEFLLDTLQKLNGLVSKVSVLQNDLPAQEPISAAIERLNITQPSPPDCRASATQDTPPLVEIQNLLSYAQELVGNIQTCADHQALIINNVLDLSRLDAGKVEPSSDVVDLHALGQQIVVMMSSNAQKKSIDLSITKATTPIYLKADATIVRQVLLNLVSNAIKFTPERGRITINLRADPPNDRGKVILHGSVKDNGLGMSELEQQKLFQRFSQANRKVAQLYGGSGLGLSISKELVRVLGGEIQVESGQGKGSTFSFTSVHDLPTKEEIAKFLHERNEFLAPASSPAFNAAPDIVPPKFRLIGVAEDNPINLQYLSKSLKKLGYDSVLCTNGQEILDKFREPDSIIDCCILDMSMPVMDGLEATSLMRKYEASQTTDAVPRRIPIIALSGNALTEQISEALSAGTSDYLIKPCKQADLARTLQYWERIIHTSAEHKPMLDRMAAAR